MAQVSMMKTPAETALENLFRVHKGQLPGLSGQREDAFNRFLARGLPHRRVEEWKYSDLRAAMREAAAPAHKPSAEEAAAALGRTDPMTGIEAVRIALVNGYVSRGGSDLASLPEGVTVAPLAEALAAEHALLGHLGGVAAAQENAAYALNAAFMTDGALIRIAPGTSLERPLHLRFVNAGDQAFSTATRVLLVVGEGAQVTLIESHEGPNGVAYQTNGVLEVVAEDRAKVVHVRLNGEGTEALCLSTLTAKLGAEVAFDTLNLAVGGTFARHQVYLAFAGEGTNAGIRGATMLKGGQHQDTTLVVDHAVPHCNSRELFKTVVDGASTGVFQGKIIVRPDAQKTDGRMMSASVLLSEEATMNNKPELEIFADDVQCAHGATCGELDEDLLFYLRARGLPRPEAEALLLESFLGEAVEEGVEDEEIRAVLMGVVAGWLAARA